MYYFPRFKVHMEVEGHPLCFRVPSCNAKASDISAWTYPNPRGSQTKSVCPALGAQNGDAHQYTSTGQTSSTSFFLWLRSLHRVLMVSVAVLGGNTVHEAKFGSSSNFWQPNKRIISKDDPIAQNLILGPHGKEVTANGTIFCGLQECFYFGLAYVFNGFRPFTCRFRGKKGVINATHDLAGRVFRLLHVTIHPTSNRYTDYERHRNLDKMGHSLLWDLDEKIYKQDFKERYSRVGKSNLVTRTTKF